jgi:phosphopantetheinyl transferase (holo-ACP synthase)
MLFNLSKGFLTEMKEGLHRLWSSDVMTRMPRHDITRICQGNGHLSIHGLKLDLGAGGPCPKSLLDSLTPEERKQVDGLERSWKTKQYCFGRTLAKRSVIDVCTQIGVPVKSDAVSIVDDERGAPQCRVQTAREAPVVSVSLTHKGNTLLAVASMSERVGIDLEDLSEARSGTARWTTVDPDGRLKNAVRNTVEQLSGYTDPGQVATVMWCVKEAAYKALSRGRPLSPLHIVLESAGSNIVARIGSTDSLKTNVIIGCVDQYVCALAI